MIDRKDLLKQYEAHVDREGLFIKTLDQLYQADAYFETQVTDFLTPDLIIIIEQIAAYHTEVKVLKHGVFTDAERQKLFLVPAFAESPLVTDNMALLEVHYNQKFNQLAHRDALGALMSLGVKRTKIGDIVPFEGGFQIVVECDLKDYFLHSVDQIGRAGVTIKSIPFDHAIEKVTQVKHVQGTVQSLRVDGVIALAYNCSRNETKQLLESGRVKINHLLHTKTDTLLKVNDLISVRGYGRFTVNEILGTTKKDRIRIVLALVSK